MNYTVLGFLQQINDKFSKNIMFYPDLTYSQVVDLVYRRAAYLQTLGLAKGDIVGLIAVNGPEWCISHMAILAAGYQVLALDTNLDLKKHQVMLEKLKAKAFFASTDFAYKIPGIKRLDVNLSGALSDREKFKKTDIQEQDGAALLYTSGTTGDPKVVQLTHRNIIITAFAGSEYMGVLPTDVVLAIMPLYHVYGLIANIYAILASGSELVFQPSLKAQDIKQSLQEHGITIFPAVPQLWELFFEGIVNKARQSSELKYKIFMFFALNASVFNKIGLGFIPRIIFKPIHQVFGERIRFLLSGGAALKPKYYKYYRNMGFKIVEGYGLTETTGPICATQIEETKVATVGRPLPGNESKIKNPGSNGIGEVWLRGDAVMAGYYENPKANAEVFDDEGWFNSGDIGYIDDDGALFITGRKKNVIVLDSGKNVYPEELEAHYMSAEGIKELAVFGYNLHQKEVIYAVIVVANPDHHAYKNIKLEIQTLNESLPSYMRMQHFALSYDPLPRTSTRKVIIDEVIKRLDRGEYQTGDDSSFLHQKEYQPSSDREEQVYDLLKKRYKLSSIFLDMTLDDLNVDSLGKIELINYLEDKLLIDINLDAVSAIHYIPAFISTVANCPLRSGKDAHHDLLNSPIQTELKTFYNPFITLFLAISRRLSKRVWRLSVDHPERLKPDNVIFVSNHQSNMDIIWILSAIPRALRKKVYVIGKKEVSFMQFLFPGLRIIFVDRKGNVFPAMKAGADILRQGGSLLLFPEGTRSEDGDLNDFKIGAAYLASELNRPLVPITVDGGYKIMPKKSFMPKFRAKEKVQIRVGAPIQPEKFNTVEELNDFVYTVIDRQLKEI